MHRGAIALKGCSPLTVSQSLVPSHDFHVAGPISKTCRTVEMLHTLC